MTSRQAEQNANNALGRLITHMLPTCAVTIENTRVIAGNPGLRPDILITGGGAGAPGGYRGGVYACGYCGAGGGG